MPQDTSPPMTFASIAGKKVQADFDAGTLSSDGRVLFLRTVEAHVGVIRRLSQALHDRGAIKAMSIILMTTSCVNGSFKSPVAMRMPMTVIPCATIRPSKPPVTTCRSPATHWPVNPP
jgi:hypothetical protein